MIGNSAQTTAKRLLQDPGTFATTLLVLILDQYSTEATQWSAEAIRRQLEEDFGVKLPIQTLDKIMAGMLLLTTNLFYTDVSVFIQICNVLSGSIMDPAVFDPADSGEMAWGITEGMLIYPPDEDDGEEPFDNEIRRYIGKQLDQEGFTDPPDVLRIGIRDVSPNDPNAVFADDPEIYNAFWDKKQSDRDDITQMLRDNMSDLLIQLETVPLQSGDPTELIRKLREGLANGKARDEDRNTVRPEI